MTQDLTNPVNDKKILTSHEENIVLKQTVHTIHQPKPFFHKNNSYI
jgi:hypothetical protein